MTTKDEEFAILMNNFRDSIICLNNWEGNKEDLKEKIKEAGQTVKKIIKCTQGMERYQEVMKEKKNWSIFTSGWMSLLIKTAFSSKSKANKTSETPFDD